jgi:glutamate 5-kinase
VLLGSATSAHDLLAGRGGTCFAPTGSRRSARLLWLAHATHPRGRLVLDDGAVAAVCKRGKSLLPAGITAVQGEFDAGDPVELVALDGTAVARGLVAYDSAELPPLLGRSTRELGLKEVVHRDDLVLL